MEIWGIGAFLGIAMGLSSIPLFLIFMDYHKKGNIHRAIIFILLFFALLFIFKFILLPLFSFYIVLVVPISLLAYLLISKL